MRRSEIKRIKDPYRLWYEYLKRSEKYKKLCAAMQAGRSLEPTEENLKLLDAYYSWGDVFVNSFVESYTKFKRNRSPVTREAVTDYKAEFRNEAMNIIENYKNETGRAITSPELDIMVDSLTPGVAGRRRNEPAQKPAGLRRAIRGPFSPGRLLR